MLIPDATAPQDIVPDDISVRAATNADADRWDAFTEQFPTVPPLCRFVWKGVLERMFQADTRFYVALDGKGEIAGILPAYVTRSPRGRKRLFSLHRGFIAKTPAAEKALLQRLDMLRQEQKLTAIQFSTAAPLELWPHPPTVKNSLILDLAPTVDETWKSLRAKTRNMVRKAEKNGLVVEHGYQNLRAFHDIYAERLLGLGVPIHGYALFQEMAEKLADDALLIVARKDAEIIAGLFIIFGKFVGIYPFQATKNKYQKLAVTQLLIWEAAKSAVDRGIARIDMGESRPGSPVYQSKINFGGLPEDVFYYDRPPPGRPEPSTQAQTPVRTFRVPAATIVNKYLMTRSPMWVRRPYGLWTRKRGRLLF
jgi:hypothetical protein